MEMQNAMAAHGFPLSTNRIELEAGSKSPYVSFSKTLDADLAAILAWREDHCRSRCHPARSHFITRHGFQHCHANRWPGRRAPCTCWHLLRRSSCCQRQPCVRTSESSQSMGLTSGRTPCLTSMPTNVNFRRYPCFLAVARYPF